MDLQKTLDTVKSDLLLITKREIYAFEIDILRYKKLLEEQNPKFLARNIATTDTVLTK